MSSNTHFPASISVLEYNARMRRQDADNAREWCAKNDEGRPWVLDGDYRAAAAEHDRAVEALREHGALRAERDQLRDAYDHLMDTAVQRWHESDEDEPIHDWLGITFDEYGAWVENPAHIIAAWNPTTEETPT